MFAYFYEIKNFGAGFGVVKGKLLTRKTTTKKQQYISFEADLTAGEQVTGTPDQLSLQIFSGRLWHNRMHCHILFSENRYKAVLTVREIAK
jgi:hypothetical protein